jgi:hypothetical protein
MYNTATMPSANAIARGIVRAGSRVSPLTLSPVSTPMNAKTRMSAASPTLLTAGTPGHVRFAG